MFYFLLFIYNLLFVVVVTLLYFFLKEYKRVKNNGQLLFFLYLIFGTILFIYEYFIAYYSTSIFLGCSIIEIFLLSLSIYDDRKIIFYILPIAIIGTFFNLLHSNFVLIDVILITLLNFLIIISMSWLINYSKIKLLNNMEKKYKLFFSVIFYLVFFYVSVYIYYFISSKIAISQIFGFLFLSLLIGIVFTFVINYALSLIDGLYTNYFNLSKNLFDKKQSYYKMALWKKELNKKIFTENISYGALVFIKMNDKNISESRAKIYIEDISININKSYKDVFYFKSNTLYYSFFIPMMKKDIELELFYKNNNLEKRERDFFFELEKILVKNIDEEIYVKAFVSIYGVTSNNINDLTKNNEYLMFEGIKEDLKYPIQIFDYRVFKNLMSTRDELSKFILEYDNYKINFYLNFSKKKIYHYNVLLTKNSQKHYLHDLKFNMSEKEYQYLLRFFSLNAIKNFKKEKFNYLVINYPIKNIISDDFVLMDFVNKINKNFKYPIEKLIVGFEIKNLDLSNLEKASLILKKFQDYNLSYAILDSENYLEKYNELLNPLWKFDSKKLNFVDKIFDLTII